MRGFFVSSSAAESVTKINAAVKGLCVADGSPVVIQLPVATFPVPSLINLHKTLAPCVFFLFVFFAVVVLVVFFFIKLEKH